MRSAPDTIDKVHEIGGFDEVDKNTDTDEVDEVDNVGDVGAVDLDYV